LPVIVPPTVNALPADKLIVPSVELIVPLELEIKSPVLVEDVNDTFIPALMAALIDRLRPANTVTVPSAELTAAEIVMSPVAPVDVKLTLPNPPADTAPLTPNVAELAEVAKLILPAVVVVIPLVVRLPVPAVKLKFTPVNAAFTSVDVVLLVIVYVVNPIPALKLIACTVLTFAVTVKFVIVPVPLPCNKSTSSFPLAESVNAEAVPLYAINICEVPLPPMFPLAAVKLTCPP